VFRINVTYQCEPGTSGQVFVEARQNVGGGFVASGFGGIRSTLTCDNRDHVERVTVMPFGERGFKKGGAFVVATVESCGPESCTPVSTERTITIF
jgi:hypothetical protein